MADGSVHPLFQKLEPEANHGLDPNHSVLASIAVSLKRIADAVAPASGQDIEITLFYAGQAVERLAGRG